jgi:hypothetical protein
MERGFINLLYIQLFNAILYQRMTKVDRQMSVTSRDKCPVHEFYSYIFAEQY